jgi:hypothetical protein
MLAAGRIIGVTGRASELENSNGVLAVAIRGSVVCPQAAVESRSPITKVRMPILQVYEQNMAK